MFKEQTMGTVSLQECQESLAQIKEEYRNFHVWKKLMLKINKNSLQIH